MQLSEIKTLFDLAQRHPGDWYKIAGEGSLAVFYNFGEYIIATGQEEFHYAFSTNAIGKLLSLLQDT